MRISRLISAFPEGSAYAKGVLRGQKAEVIWRKFL